MPFPKSTTNVGRKSNTERFFCMSLMVFIGIPFFVETQYLKFDDGADLFRSFHDKLFVHTNIAMDHTIRAPRDPDIPYNQPFVLKTRFSDFFSLCDISCASGSRAAERIERHLDCVSEQGAGDVMPCLVMGPWGSFNSLKKKGSRI